MKQKIQDLLYPIDLEEGDIEVKIWNNAIRKVLKIMEDEE